MDTKVLLHDLAYEFVASDEKKRELIRKIRRLEDERDSVIQKLDEIRGELSEHVGQNRPRKLISIKRGGLPIVVLVERYWNLTTVEVMDPDCVIDEANE